MAECTGRRQKKKKQKNMDQRNAGSLSTEHAEFSDKDILKYLIAAQSNDVDTVLRFLQCGMPVDTECLMFSDTALIKACRMGSVEAAQLLLDWGADIATRTDDGQTALHVAVKNCQPDIIQLLFSRGAALDVKAFQAELTPLMLAASISNTVILRLLIAAGSNLDLQDRNGMCALHHCFSYYQERVECIIHSVDCVKLLVMAGADIHIRDSSGYLPLTRAVEKQNVRGVRYLIAQNCDLENQVLQLGLQKCLSPLSYAVSMGNYRLANMLWQAGASCQGVLLKQTKEALQRRGVDHSTLAFSRPRTLKEACRKAVRDKLRSCGVVGQTLLDAMQRLGIPAALQDFVLMKDVLGMK